MKTTQPLNEVQINDMLTALQKVFRQVGPRIVERAGKVAHTNKHDGSPVTDIDVEVEGIIHTEMRRQFPDVPFFGEESGYGDDLPDVVWLIDPIDGTKSFIANIPSFTSMGVLIQAGEAVAAIIYNPSTDEMYIAQKGRGAYKNDVKLDLASVSLPRQAFCKDYLTADLDAMLKPLGVVCETPSTGAGFGFSQVADGVSAARFNLHGGGYVHDYAPGALLVREAGGSIIPILDEVYTYKTKSLVACHPALTELVRARMELLRELEARSQG